MKSFALGGAEKQALFLASYLQKNYNCTVNIYSYIKSNHPELFFKECELLQIKNLHFVQNPLSAAGNFNYIKRQDPYSLESVRDLLKKFKNNVHLIKGNSNKILKKIDMSKIDFVFLDGGHDYETVKNDLNNCTDVLINNGTILCDDYDLTYAPGVKKAIDEFVANNNFNCEIVCDYRFAKIQKK